MFHGQPHYNHFTGIKNHFGASYVPMVDLLAEVAGQVISNVIVDGKQVSGWHGLYVHEREN